MKEFLYLSWFCMVCFATSTVSTVDGAQSHQFEDTCVYIDYFGKEYNEDELACSNSRICKKAFKISNILFPPFNMAEHEENEGGYLATILKKCCGSCVDYETIHNVDSIAKVTRQLINASDFVYPFLAKITSSKLHGYHFLPYKTAPITLFITKTDNDILFKSIFELYPLLVVCLLLAVVSGFIAWIIETWSNKEQFPRPFLIGWFEGFWWSFISMTTVGYGDKCPKSIPSRLFAVVWILIGIIACGIITGQLTGQVIKANNPPPASMKGNMVGVLNHRDYDAFVISQNGGRITWNANVSNFNADVMTLITKLQEDKINGFLVDRETLIYITHELRNTMKDVDDVILKSRIRFFLSHTTRVEITNTKADDYAYGILVKQHEDYAYLKNFVEHLQHQNMIDDAIEWNVFTNDVKEDEYGRIYDSNLSMLFSPSDYFMKSMMAIGIMLGLILTFGILYELKRRKYISKCFKRSGVI